jgi:hypothetical protein
LIHIPVSILGDFSINPFKEILFFVVLNFPGSSTNETDHHDITEILLKVALNTIKQTNKKYTAFPSYKAALTKGHPSYQARFQMPSVF